MRVPNWAVINRHPNRDALVHDYINETAAHIAPEFFATIAAKAKRAEDAAAERCYRMTAHLR